MPWMIFHSSWPLYHKKTSTIAWWLGAFKIVKLTVSIGRHANIDHWSLKMPCIHRWCVKDRFTNGDHCALKLLAPPRFCTHFWILRTSFIYRCGYCAITMVGWSKNSYYTLFFCFLSVEYMFWNLNIFEPRKIQNSKQNSPFKLNHDGRMAKKFLLYHLILFP